MPHLLRDGRAARVIPRRLLGLHAAVPHAGARGTTRRRWDGSCGTLGISATVGAFAVFALSDRDRSDVHWMIVMPLIGVILR